jgi:hypothetical protein
MSVRRCLLGSLILLLVAAACGGGDDDEAEPPTTDESQAEGPCALLTVEEVSDLFGEDAEVAPPAGDGPTSTCLWEATAEDGDFPTRHQLQLQVYEGGGELNPRSYGEESEPIEGLGDEAFLVPSGTLGTTAGYRDGERTVIIHYAVIGGEDAPRSADSSDEVVDLLRETEGRSSDA